MATFTPPTNDTEVAGVPRGAWGAARRLAQLATGGPRGRNVFYLSDGSVTEADPDSRVVFWSNPGDGSTYVVQTWWGSTDQPYTVTSAQASALTTAGYTVA